jgi:hypothetical protein
MTSTRAVVLAAFGLMAFGVSGCLDGEPNSSKGLPSGDEAAAGKDYSAFEVQMRDCVMAGGVSVYNSSPDSVAPVEPFLAGNIKDDVGDPRFASYMDPVESDWLQGIWHINVRCDAYDYEGVQAGTLDWAFVGVKVQPPEWDDSGIEEQWFVADIAFKDTNIVNNLKGLTGVHVSELWAGVLEWEQGTALHTVIDDEENGRFETHAVMEYYKPFEKESMRFWMLVGGDGHGHGHECVDPCAEPMYRPVAIDLVNDVEGAKHYVAFEDAGWLSHTRTAHHGNVPGAAGNVGAVVFEGHDTTISIGLVPDVMLEETWIH